MTHQIVAIKVETKRGNTILSTITQSPRGTRVLLDSVTVPGVGQDKATHKAEVKAALDTLLAKSD